MNILIIESNQSGLKAIPTAKKLMHHVTFIQIQDYSPWPKTPENLNQVNQADEIITVPKLNNKGSILDIVKLKHLENPFDLILPLEDLTSELSTWVAEKLNIKSTNHNALMICRNKLKCRQVIESKHLKSVPCELVSNTNELNNYKGSYPAVIKPSFGKLSHKAIIVTDFKEAKSVLEEILSHVPDHITERGFLIEQYIFGDLISVEIACTDNKPTAFMVTSRKRSLSNDAFELGSGMPCPLPEDIYKRATDYAEAAVNAVGLDVGMAHVELILENGFPVLVEINPRIMGGPLEVIYKNVTGGENIYEYLLSLYSTLPKIPPKALDNRFVNSICLFSNAEQHLPMDFNENWIKHNLSGVVESRIIASPGDFLHKGSMIGFIFSIADNAVNSEYLCEQAFLRIADYFNLDLLT